MNNPRKNNISEQIPNDGGYHFPRLVKEANDRLSKLGKHGKRAKLKVTPKPGKPISVQFSLPELGQQNYGLDLPLNRSNLIKAEDICQLITNQLVAGTFTEQWFYSLIGKKQKAENKEEKVTLTGKEMLEQYKKYYLKQHKEDKSPERSWTISFRYIEKVLTSCDEPISLKVVREIIEHTENNSQTRIRHLRALTNLLKYFDNNEFKNIIKKYKSENKPKSKTKHIPDDNEIMNVYNRGFQINKRCPKDYRYRYVQWQFLYGLLAVYGLRIHEAWNIKNWSTPVILKDGDWLAIDDNTGNTNDKDENDKYIYRQYRGNKIVIPAILDPNNNEHLLCIGHETKTGYRVAFPLSPNGHDWIKEFNLLQPLNLPDIPNPLNYLGTNKDGGIGCTHQSTRWFKNKKYGFTPHALRHAYNIRGHKLGVNQKVLCDSLGHGLQMNSNTYLRHEGDSSKLQGIRQAINEDNFKRSENERLKLENEQLKTENEKLRTEVTMYKTLFESQSKNMS